MTPENPTFFDDPSKENPIVTTAETYLLGDLPDIREYYYLADCVEDVVLEAAEEGYILDADDVRATIKAQLVRWLSDEMPVIVPLLPPNPDVDADGTP